MSTRLSERQQFTLLVRAQTGDREATHALLNHFRPIVRSVIRERGCDYGDPDDLEQIGLIGALAAIRHASTKHWLPGADLLSFEVRIRVRNALEEPLSPLGHYPQLPLDYYDEFPFHRTSPRLHLSRNGPVTTTEWKLLLHSRRGDIEARESLLAVLSPYVAALIRTFTPLGSDVESLARSAVLEVADQYPLSHLGHIDPQVPLFDWVDARAEGTFRRLARLWPYDSEPIRLRAEKRARILLREARTSLIPVHRQSGHRETLDAELPQIPRKRRAKREPSAPARYLVEPMVSELSIKDLVASAKSGRAEAREEVCKRFRPLIYSLLPPGAMSREDMEQEAQIALLKALQEYHPSKGTFAWLAERRIRDAINRTLRLESPPHDAYSEEYDDEADEHHPGPAAEILKVIHRSWDYQTGVWGGSGIWEGAEEDLEMVMAVVLDDEEGELLGRLRGLSGYARTSQQQLATELGVTQQAISKRARHAIKKLEDANWARAINQYWDELGRRNSIQSARGRSVFREQVFVVTIGRNRLKESPTLIGFASSQAEAVKLAEEQGFHLAPIAGAESAEHVEFIGGDYWRLTIEPNKSS